MSLPILARSCWEGPPRPRCQPGGPRIHAGAFWQRLAPFGVLWWIGWDENRVPGDGYSWLEVRRYRGDCIMGVKRAPLRSRLAPTETGKSQSAGCAQ